MTLKKSVGIDFMILRHSQLANDSFYELFVFDPTVSF
jgi:hypothetical protein